MVGAAPLARDDAGEARPSNAAFAAFHFFLATAILLHRMHESGLGAPSLAHRLLPLVAVWSLLHPQSVRACLVLAAAQIGACAIEMPFVWNHWLFLALANLGLLAAAAERRWRGRLDGGALLAFAAPALRLALIELYGFAAFAKLNPAYFDPQTSCAVVLYQRLTSFVPLLPSGDWTAACAIGGSFGVELLLALLLVLRRTRVIAVLLGLVFHVFLGINDNYDFSAILLPFYSLFVPEPLWNDAARLLRTAPPVAGAWRAIVGGASRPLTFAALAIPTLLADSGVDLVGAVRWHAHALRSGKILWLALCLATLFLLIAVRRRGGEQEAAQVARPSGAAFVAPLLVALCALTPYVGLNTEHAFAMFSNLRTEGGEWNHSLLPPAVRIFGFQDVLYEIRESSDPILAEAAARKQKMVLFEIRRRLGAEPQATLALADVHQAAVGDPTEMRQPLPPLLAWWMWFHPVEPGGACAH